LAEVKKNLAWQLKLATEGSTTVCMNALQGIFYV